MKLSLRILVITLTILSLSACDPVGSPRVIKPDNSTLLQAVQAENIGDYSAAAELYLQLAAKVEGSQQAEFYLRAALAYWQQQDELSAESTLNLVQRDLLSPAHNIDAALLQAEIADYRQQAEQVLSALRDLDLALASHTQKRAILQHRIKAYQTTENWLEKANSHILLAELLPYEHQAQNQAELWQALTSLTPQALDLFNPGIPPAIDSGWFALAYAITAYQSNPEALTVAIEDWKRNYPNHPADASLYEDALKAGTQLPQDIADIAVLLPSTGPYAKVAKAIKQGLIAAYYADENPIKLHFLDVETNEQTGSSNIWQRYQQAIDMQANVVIGPLSKNSIQVLLDADTLDIPVLALNRASDTIHKTNLYQFGLAPEDDANTAAEYALNKGFSRAIILAPESDWGKRIASAFSDKWIMNGGTILKQASYSESANDFSTSITSMFELDASKQRNKALEQRLAQNLEFEPRRRQDIDFVFLVARGLKARQLMPQLKFHRSGALPVISTSHAYGGYENSQQDIDLNGLTINDIPWVFPAQAAMDPIYNSIVKNKPDHFNSLLRLYALGADAYHLIPNLNELSRVPSSTFDGATGVLSIDDFGQVNRTMSPATFKNGVIKPL